jgi:hypothetical protein
MPKSLKIFLPIRLQTPNIKEHWSKTYRRNKRQAKTVALTCKQQLATYKLPVTITLVRIATRTMDYDNMVYSFKAIRDCISSLLLPDLKPGQADGHSGIKFEYRQNKQTRKGIAGVEITVEEIAT